MLDFDIAVYINNFSFRYLIKTAANHVYSRYHTGRESIMDGQDFFLSVIHAQAQKLYHLGIAARQLPASVHQFLRYSSPDRLSLKYAAGLLLKEIYVMLQTVNSILGTIDPVKRGD